MIRYTVISVDYARKQNGVEYVNVADSNVESKVKVKLVVV